MLDPSNHSGGAELFSDIQGAVAYHGGATDGGVSGISADGSTLTIRLVRPRPEILQKLATPFGCPVPAATPTGDQGTLSGSGPYTVQSKTNDLIVLARNAHYGGTRLAPFDTMRIFLGVDQASAQARALAGATDYVMGGTNRPRRTTCRRTIRRSSSSTRRSSRGTSA